MQLDLTYTVFVNILFPCTVVIYDTYIWIIFCLPRFTESVICYSKTSHFVITGMFDAITWVTKSGLEYWWPQFYLAQIYVAWNYFFPYSVAKDFGFMTNVLQINQSNTEQIMAFSDINMSLISIKNFDIPRC